MMSKALNSQIFNIQLGKSYKEGSNILGFEVNFSNNAEIHHNHSKSHMTNRKNIEFERTGSNRAQALLPNRSPTFFRPRAVKSNFEGRCSNKGPASQCQLG